MTEFKGICTFLCLLQLISLHSCEEGTKQKICDNAANSDCNGLNSDDTSPSGPSNEGNNYKVVCYFNNWAFKRQDKGKFFPDYPKYEFCTHIVYGFAVLSDGKLKIEPANINNDFNLEFKNLLPALKSMNKKVLLALGGWVDSEGDKYSKLVSNSTARHEFTTHAVSFLKQHDFDGLDLNWQHPTCWQGNCSAGPESDKANFANWVKELSAALKAKGLLLTIPVASSAKIIDKAYDIPTLSRYLDYVSVTSYNYHNHFDNVTGHVAPIKDHPDDVDKTLNVDYTIQYLLKQGLESNKLVLGLPFYGQSFTLEDPSNHGLNAQTSGAGIAGNFTNESGTLSYYEICEKVTKEGWAVVRDPEGRMGPFAYKDNQWVSFDDLDTVQQKMKYVKEQKLGGAMVWALDLDDFHGTFCPTGYKYPLLRTVNSELGLIPHLEDDTNKKILEGL